MQGVETVGLAQEVGGGFAGATDAAEFNDFMRPQTQLIPYLHNLAGDGVVTATLAQGSGVAVVIGFGQAD